jgi:hypothetical protein
MSENTIYQQQTLFAEDSLAKTFPHRDSGLDSLVSGQLSGMSSTVSFAKFDHNGLLLKMYQGFFQVTLDGSLERFCGNFPKAGMMQNGTLFQRPHLAHRIGGIESSLLPTPRATDYKASTSLKAATGYIKRGFSPNLPEFVITQEQTGGQLNPAYHEYLMGFPIGWTELSPQETA